MRRFFLRKRFHCYDLKYFFFFFIINVGPMFGRERNVEVSWRIDRYGLRYLFFFFFFFVKLKKENFDRGLFCRAILIS